MITTFRRYLETWPVRFLFGIMVLAFVVWGVGDVVRMIGHPSWLAKADGQMIQPQQFQSAFERELAQAQQHLPPGPDMTQTVRQAVANETLRQLIGDITMANEVARLRVAVPDAALRQAVFSFPAFRGSNGQFDRAKLDAALRANGLSEPQFLGMVRSQLAESQVMDAVTAGAAVPKVLAEALFDYETEKRSAQMVELPFAAAPAPPPPSEAELKRWYANHPDAFRVPEFRKIKAAILSAETLAKSVKVADQEMRAWYDQHRDQFAVAPKRSISVVMNPDQGKAKALAAQWHAGADWAAIHKSAEAEGGSAVQFPQVTEAQIPDATLAQAAFAAAPGIVIGPVKTALGWADVRVDNAEPPKGRSFDQVKDEVRQRVAAEKAGNLLYDRVNKVDDVLGTGVGLDKLPSDLGLVGVTGTLDAAGNTQAGTPAPIPGPPALRKALVAAAFAKQAGPPSELTEVQTPSVGGSAFYAVEVEDVHPATIKPFDAVKTEVQSDWTEAARKKEEERQAAQLVTAINGGESLDDAAAKAGLSIRTTPTVTRDEKTDAMPPQLQRVLFGLKKGEATMVETAEAFVVAVANAIEVPDPKSEPDRYTAMQQVLARSAGQDLATTFASALRARAHTQINHAVFDSFVQ